VSRHRAYVGAGANLGDPAASVERALAALGALGLVTRSSSLYRTRPWGKTDQPDFVNAAAMLETDLEPRALLAALKDLERRLGRVETERWGPRLIDLDLLAFDEVELDEPGLRLPHPRLRERAFALVPLAEIEPRYAAARDALPAEELQGVEPLRRGTVALMPGDGSELTQRVRRLAEFLAESGAVRVRVERADDEVEVTRVPREPVMETAQSPAERPASRVETIKADLVGIFRLSRPAPLVGDLLEEGRELAYIEALGIRTPVRSLGGGRILAIAPEDGAPVEYGQALFLLDRG
jgi:2-amino-4-hydroxy-6-hydroxymethyldihydropteridine diphosphokinase